MKLKVDKSRIKARWEEDYELIPNEGLFEEYLEMGMVSVTLLHCLLLQTVEKKCVLSYI